jgi:hypothetical protein
MDFKSAINFSKENHSSLDDEGKQIIGVSYVPSNRSDERFEIFTISYNFDIFKDEGEDWFDVACDGEPEWGGNSGSDLLSEIPESAKKLNYQVFKAEIFFMLETWYMLKIIFPELPDQGSTEFISDNEFEKRASALVSRLNNQ